MKIPKSKAKTAYGLLSDIAALALAEPRRIRMSMFLDTNARERFTAQDVPACNTVGCIFGWAVALKGTKDQISDQSNAYIGLRDFGDMPGAVVLGLNTDQAQRLFNADTGITSRPGTPAHARQVVKRIRKFQKANRAQLLAKKV